MMLGRVLIALIGAVPVVYFVIIMGWGASISKQIADVQSGKSTDISFSTPLTWIAEAKEYRQFFDTDTLNRRRAVTIEIETTIDTLLNAGEERPDPGLFTLYATARAPGVLSGECDLVLDSLGTLCDVSDFEAKTDASGKVRITGELVYLPAYDMGSPDGIANGAFISLYERIDRTEPLPNTREGKLQALAAAEAQCASLRETYGNCVIERVRIEPDRYKDGTELTASTVLQIYADQTQHSRDTITASLRSAGE